MRKKKRIIKTALAVMLMASLSTPMSASAELWDSSINTDKSNDGTTTYTNRVTGKTFTEYADGSSSGDFDYSKFPKKESEKQMIRKGNSIEIKIYPSYNQTLSNVKVTSGKKNLSAKITYSNVTTNKKINCSLDENNRYYYKDPRTDERVYTESKSVLVTETVYGIRLTGKKVGNAKISYQFNDLNGNKISSNTMKVSVVNNSKVIKEITFGGKSLLTDMTDNSKYIYATDSKNSIGYTTKKSGKLKVKTNKFYRLNSIYVITASDYIDKPYDKSTGYTDGTYSERQLHALDINGDGDCNDIIDGIEESAQTQWNYKKVKNGARIKLNKIPDSVSKINRSVDRAGNTTDYNYAEESSSNMSTTYFMVSVQDKRTGRYYTETFSVTRRISK